MGLLLVYEILIVLLVCLVLLALGLVVLDLFWLLQDLILLALVLVIFVWLVIGRVLALFIYLRLVFIVWSMSDTNIYGLINLTNSGTILLKLFTLISAFKINLNFLLLIRQLHIYPKLLRLRTRNPNCLTILILVVSYHFVNGLRRSIEKKLLLSLNQPDWIKNYQIQNLMNHLLHLVMLRYLLRFP